MLHDTLKKAYYAWVPELRRKQLYKLLHYRDYQRLRTVVHPSPKGNFSLRGFDARQAIFIHIPKAAGTSIALSIFGELPYHYRAIDYIVIFGRRTFNDYFKFAFVRNPWDRLYSAYHFLRQGGWDDKDHAWAQQHLAAYRDFDHFVTHWLCEDRLHDYMHFIPQHEFICDERGRLAVDYLGYFETINDDFAGICRQLGIEAHLKHTNRSTRLDYMQHYNGVTRDIVARVYRKDIELFGYAFDGIRQRTVIGA